MAPAHAHFIRRPLKRMGLPGRRRCRNAAAIRQWRPWGSAPGERARGDAPLPACAALRRPAQAAAKRGHVLASSRLILPIVLLLLLPGWSGCDADSQRALDDLSGKPKAAGAANTANPQALAIPAGPNLYCITNIGHTLVLYDLAANQARTDLQHYLDLDPVGPWFSRTSGYYISRVDTSGRGANALIEFDPKTALETRRLGLGINTNPNALLPLPGYQDVAWIAVRGSTFNSPYGPDGIAVVNLGTMTGQIVALTDVAGLPNAANLHLLISFLWDDACPARSTSGGGPCVYALVNGFDGALHAGTLLVLAPDAAGNPVWIDSVALGVNPLEDMFLDPVRRRLWIVNNGGYSPLPPDPAAPQGTLQVLDATKLGDGIAGNETLATIPAGFAPSGIFGFDANTAWVTTYPADHVQSVDLGTYALNASPGLPDITGSMLRVTVPATRLFAGAGGFSTARLVQLDPTDGQLLATATLDAGDGPVSCAAFTTP